MRKCAYMLWVACLQLAAGSLPAQQLDPATLGGLRARSIGPAVMSGRITSLDAVAADPLTIYVGSAGGGVWKSTDGGVRFQPIFDDHTMSIGAIRIDPSDPQRVWVGTGESWTRNTVSVGDGVYLSTDAGKTWQHKGLSDSERIARIAVHPADSNTVYVCATGHLWDSNEERGVYRTSDGGETWTRVLYVDEETGCADLSLDPQDPRILYAAMWQFRRQPWTFRSGGPGSGLYRSKDGGENWTELTEGLPEGEKGRIGVAVAPSRPSTVYAVVEAEETALYRSDDLGEHWERLNSSFNVTARPFYFAHLVVDPTDHRRVYKPGFTLTFSDDGGKSFTSPFSTTGFGPPSIHSDLHALWINPHNAHEMIVGTDGGVYFSYDRGASWRHSKALPVSQFYVVSYDLEFPYNVYGGLQDNGTWTGPSRSAGGVQARDWTNIGSGDGFHAYVDPREPDFVYVEYQGGNLQRRRRSTGENKSIKPYAEQDAPKLRFNWNTPVHLSPSDPGTLYVGAQYLFRTRDRGDSWERISPDLTTNDPEKQRQNESGGLTIDNSTAENHTTIYTISESPLDGQVVWVGTDDGNLQLTRDGGGSWENVTANLDGVPAGTWVSRVEASRFEAGTAYVTFDGHRTGDMQPYVFRTRDFGQSWEELTEGVEGFARVIREDLVNPDLLFLGTELGLYLSMDGGAHWTRFGNGFPKVAVYDLAIHSRDHDLIIATHGRGVWILDDITPLRALTPEVLDAELALLPTRPAVMTIGSSLQEFPGDDEFVGVNPGEAASIVYFQRRRHIFGDLKVEVYDEQGELITTLPGGKVKGINRVDWPMRLPAPTLPPSTVLVPVFQGPRVAEGEYTFKVVKGKETYEGRVSLVADPRSSHSVQDRRLQQETALELYRHLEELSYVVEALVDLRDQARRRAEELGDEAGTELSGFADQLDGFRKTLVATSESGMLSGEEQLREELGELYGAVNGYDGRPTESELRRKEVLESRLEQARQRFGEVTAADRLGELDSSLELLTREAWQKKRETGGE